MNDTASESSDVNSYASESSDAYSYDSDETSSDLPVCVFPDYMDIDEKEAFVKMRNLYREILAWKWRKVPLQRNKTLLLDFVNRRMNRVYLDHEFYDVDEDLFMDMFGDCKEYVDTYVDDTSYIHLIHISMILRRYIATIFIR